MRNVLEYTSDHIGRHQHIGRGNDVRRMQRVRVSQNELFTYQMTPQFLEIIEVRNGGGEWQTRVFVGMTPDGDLFECALTYDDECAAALGLEYRTATFEQMRRIDGELFNYL